MRADVAIGALTLAPVLLGIRTLLFLIVLHHPPPPFHLSRSSHATAKRYPQNLLAVGTGLMVFLAAFAGLELPRNLNTDFRTP